MKTCSFFIAIIFFACSSHYKYRDVSDFNMQPKALQDGEPVKLLYTSQGPDVNGKADFYIQIIVVSQKTGDTVNVLTPVNNGFLPTDGDVVFNYISPSNPSYSLIQMNEQELKNIKHIDSIPKIETGAIKKVACDPDHDDVARNKFPTVIGAIGTIGSVQ